MKLLIKNIALTFIFLSGFVNFAFGGIFEDSFKIYSKDADTLYMSALSAINQSNKYEVIEMQSKNGYILILFGSKYYLITVTKRYQNQTEIKILPQNSDFSQGSAVASEIFSLIDKKLSLQKMEQIK